MAKDLELGAAGTVVDMAYRPTESEAMRAISHADVLEKRGLALENRNHGKRELTLLSQEAWRAVCAELGVALHWHTRRVNLLVAGIDLTACIGRALNIGGVRVWIHGETRPCQLMEDQQPGLLEALKADSRGGVHGQVLTGGTVRIGDHITPDTSPCGAGPTPLS